MKKLPPAILVALAVVFVASASSATKGVDITQAGFTPNKVTIDFGDTVTWTNKDVSNHQVLADQQAFPTSPVLAANQTYSYTFRKSGSFGYRDSFNTNRKGTVTVRTGVTLTAAPSTRYGKPVTLAGAVSSALAGEAVTVNAKACGTTTYARVAGATSVANGAWSLAVTPAMNTTYQATWKNAKSAEFLEQVVPGLFVKRLSAGHYRASLAAAQAFTGKVVLVQRRARGSKTWVTMKRLTLRTAKPGVAPTVVTTASFRARLKRGTMLRLLLQPDQSAPCYATGVSAAIRA